MIKRRALLTAISSFVVFMSFTQLSFGQRRPTPEELQLLRKDVDTIKTNQAQIENAVKELKELARAPQPAPAPPPKPESIVLGIDDDPLVGDKKARLVIVEFSDFQCPFCKAVIPTLHQLLKQYDGKVRLIFRDFPIPSLHPLAAKAHEAARCAAEQGKFWEYHDVLFERSPRLEQPELKQYARDLKLDGAAFDRCLDSGKTQAAVSADVVEGQRLGVSGTPAFFINGRMLVGNQPPNAFQQLIDSELSKKPK